MQQNEFVSQCGPNVIMAVPRYTHMRAFDGDIITLLPERRTIDMRHKLISEGFYTLKAKLPPGLLQYCTKRIWFN